MKNKTKLLPLLLCLILIACVSVVTVFAAYFGKGILKDVFVNRKNYFSSDALISVEGADKVSSNVVNSGGSDKKINFYNYDLSTGEYNELDLTFELYAWLDTDGTGKEYKISCAGVPDVTISGTAHDDPAFAYTLKGGEDSICSITVSLDFNGDTDLSDYPKLYLFAVPTVPEYMKSRALGGAIVSTLSETYHIDGYFGNTDEDTTTEISDEIAAFIYRISVSGKLPDGEMLKIKWNAKALDLVTENGALPDGVKIEEENGFGYVLINAPADYFTELTFLRASDESDDNPWKNAVTWEMLESYVSFEAVKNS